MQILNPILVSCNTVRRETDDHTRSTKRIVLKLPMISTLDIIQEWRTMCNFNTGFSLHVRKNAGKCPSMPSTPSGKPEGRVHVDSYLRFPF